MLILSPQGTYACAAGLVSQTDDPWPVKHYITLFVIGASLSNSYAPVGSSVTLTVTMPTSQTPGELYSSAKL